MAIYVERHDQKNFSGALRRVGAPHFRSGPVPSPLSNSFRRHWTLATTAFHNGMNKQMILVTHSRGSQ